MKKILIAGLALAVMAGTSCGAGGVIQSENTPDPIEAPEPAYHKITADQAKKIMDSGDSYILLDVRGVKEYREGHIEGAMCIPHDEIAARAPDELPDQNALILVYCRSGRRSEQASLALVQLGYTQVYDFGGILDWPYETVSED